MFQLAQELVSAHGHRTRIKQVDNIKAQLNPQKTYEARNNYVDANIKVNLPYFNE